MSFDWKSLVGTVAPTIATALGGPLAGMATKAVAAALGVTTTQEIEQTLANASPDHLLALKQADQQFTVQMRELDVDLERIAAKDRDSARGLARARGLAPHIALSGLFIVGYFGLLWAITTGKASPGDGLNEAFLLLIGLMTREIPTIMQFWFGSSAGSKQKTDIMGASK